MRKRKYWLYAAGGLLVLILTVRGVMGYQWSTLTAEQKAGTITERMARRHDLTEEQRNRVYNLNLEKVQYMETACKDGNGNRADWKEEHRKWRSEMKEIIGKD